MKPPPASPGPPRSSDPKPREGTETGQRSTPALVDFRVVRPKTPRGDGNQVSNGGGNLAATGRSSDPKPREGTETCANPFGVMRMVGSGRQTQNPERGRKHGISAARPGRCCPRSSDPKPREGTETAWTRASCRWSGRSSDPKPREGTETRQQSRRPARMTPVVRPKTPRGDGNWIALTGLALILVVVRPKTPRGDGNSTSISLTSPGEKITSSDPKPRERTETRRRSRRCRCPNRRVVRPKTPRGDGNPQLSIADAVQLVRVVRPKTPRGDGNPTSPPAG
ncbi:Uncharacterised protein [Mycobacterium tuberculosis]|nr:Uncharacterised protein [Mycobacterium tuberculosis]